VANRLLRRIRDFAEVLGSGVVDMSRVRSACARLEVDDSGLDEMDRKYLTVIIDHYDGGPVGADALAAALAEPRDTIEDVIEPFLIQQGFVGRTPRGRVANRKAYEALAREFREPRTGEEERTLFD
jgi:Holliday junction DNA helicase RuvB